VHSVFSGVVFCLEFDPFFFSFVVPLLSVFSLFIYLKNPSTLG
jgi:hypothetical protein